MQGINIKRHRCLNDFTCRNSIDERASNSSQSLPWTCFRLPFCDIKQNETNRVHEVLTPHVPSCFNCGLPIRENDDNNNDNEGHLGIHNIHKFQSIQPIVNFNNTSPKLKLPSHVSYNRDESSTIATAAATSAGESYHSQMENNCLAEEVRYVSLDSLLRPTNVDGTTNTEMSSTDFSFESERNHQETTNDHCKSCHVTLSSHWRYCPSCGIYIETPN